MAAIFESILQGGYTVPFGGFTPSQQHCRAFTQQHLTTLLHIRQREKFVKEVRVCCCGYGPADEDEPMESNHFSQFQFYLPFTNDVIYFHDKFDFLILGIANGICKVDEGFEDRYLQALLDCMTFRETTIPAAPAHVLDLHTIATPRIVGEVRRPYEETLLLLDSYIKKRHPLGDALRAELAQLEEEQFQAEKKRGEHKSLMGWSREGSPEGYEAAVCGAAAESADGKSTPFDSQSAIQRGLNPNTQSSATPAKKAVTSSNVENNDDASIAKLRAQIALAQAEVEGEAEQQQVGGKEAGTTMPLLSMLLRVQEEQIRQEQLQKSPQPLAEEL